MASRLRKIGIDVLGEMALGAHLCLFHETMQDLLETVVPYFRAGLEANEFCVWAVSAPVTEGAAKSALRQGIPDFDEHFAAGSIEIVPGSEWIRKGGQFDLKRVPGGYSGMRVSVNAFWLATKHWEKFLEYEQVLDKALADRPLTVLCTYALNRTRAVDLLEVVRAHKFTVVRRNGNWELLESRPIDQNNAASMSAQAATSTIARLTPREREVLLQLAHGAKNKEIAARLGISERTVEMYRSRILLKTNLQNVTELVRLSIAAGMDPPRKGRPAKDR